MSQLKISNSLSGKKETFKPLHSPHVGMYVCGPTVSGESHLGHARPYITFDVVFRYLQYLGYKVRYVRNITDAGHFEEEGREAEDKISKKAVLEKLEPMELVTKYTDLFHWAMEQFNCLPPTIEPTATGHIVEQIEMINKIIKSGYAYVANGSVYFSVKKYSQKHKYGRLSNRKIDELLETTRQTLTKQDEKKNTQDFALWKKAPRKHIMRWASPWGEGFPGWHIECSAMSSKYLGKRFDIHGGGMDLMFPHHESEIAQSTICNKKTPARFWMHNNMITINGKKMGKSYNNVIKLTELFNGNNPVLKQAYHPMVVRLFILQTQYRNPLDFSNEALQASEKALDRLWDSYENLNKLYNSNVQLVTPPLQEELNLKVQRLVFELDEFMNDDFNTAKVLANLFELVPIINSIKDGVVNISSLSKDTFDNLFIKMGLYIEKILGLRGRKPSEISGILGSSGYAGYGATGGTSEKHSYSGYSETTGVSEPIGYSGYNRPTGPSGAHGYSGYGETAGTSGYTGTSSGYGILPNLGLSGTSGYAADYEKMKGAIQLLIDLRKEAKERKDFATSDRIRKQLAQAGILLKDEKDGTTSWTIA